MGQVVRTRRIKTASAESTPLAPVTVLEPFPRNDDRRAYQDGEIQGVAGPGIHQLDPLRPFRPYRRGIGTRDQAIEPDCADVAAEAPD